MTGVTPTSVKGIIIKTIGDEFMANQDIFKRNFRPFDNYRSFLVIMGKCQ